MYYSNLSDNDKKDNEVKEVEFVKNDGNKADRINYTMKENCELNKSKDPIIYSNYIIYIILLNIIIAMFIIYFLIKY
jgi:hypothetical protein